jgi:alanine-glyoxylate transaminase/serine-glyoxylate transaminase/serine-pyruvate transaminase
VVNDVPAIRAAIDASKHPALLMVDGIASIGCMRFEMDEWGVDVALTGSQKGLMMTPGLSFVAASPKAKTTHKKANLRTSYWDWTARDTPESYRMFCGTAPAHMLFGLRASLGLLFSEGLEPRYPETLCASHVAFLIACPSAITCITCIGIRKRVGDADESGTVWPRERTA